MIFVKALYSISYERVKSVNLTIALLNNFTFILIIHYHKQVLEENYIYI